jgi:hypothetical protein
MGGSDTNTNDAHYRTDIGSNTDTYVKNVESPYSSYLASLQINDFDISSKYDGTSHSIYTKTVLPNHKYIDPDDTDKNTKIDESPTKVYFNDVSSSRISLLYSKVGDAKDGHRFSSIIVPERYLDTTKKIRLSDDRKNVYVNIKQEIGDGINDCLATPTPPDSSSNNYGDDSKPLNQVYVLNDVNGLINRM